MQDSPHTAPMGAAQPVRATTPVLPDRGGIILAMGIIGIVFCFIFGIVAWVMGRNDLAEMNAGRRNRDGYSLTKAGMICGMLSVGFWILWLVWMVFVVMMVGTLGALGC